VPWLETVYRRYKGENLSVVGLTTVNRSATDEKVRRFIAANDITYPVLKEDGSARGYLDMTGTPFMTLFRDGTLVWEHRLPTEKFPLRLVEQVLAAGRD
jgi:hypothetical protein